MIRKTRPAKYRCGAQNTTNGGTCWRGVSAPGQRCYAHRGYDASEEIPVERKIETYPKQRRKRDKSRRRFRVRYDLAYDGGGCLWDGYYRSRVGAAIAIFWNMHVASYGGSADLFDRGAVKAGDKVAPAIAKHPANMPKRGPRGSAGA